MTQVLLVEDDPVQASVIEQVLTDAGWEVRVAGSAAEAKGMLDDGSVDIAVLDYRLPDGDGLEVLDWARGRGPAVPMVFLTGEGSEEVALQALSRGAVDYIVKGPSAYDDLPQRLRIAMARWEEIDQALSSPTPTSDSPGPPGSVAQDRMADRLVGFVEDRTVEGVIISDLEGRTVYAHAPDIEDIEPLKARVAAAAHQGRKVGEAAGAVPYRHTLIVRGTGRVVITAPGPQETLVTVLLRAGTGLWSAVQYLARASNHVREAFEPEGEA